MENARHPPGKQKKIAPRNGAQDASAGYGRAISRREIAEGQPRPSVYVKYIYHPANEIDRTMGSKYPSRACTCEDFLYHYGRRIHRRYACRSANGLGQSQFQLDLLAPHVTMVGGRYQGWSISRRRIPRVNNISHHVDLGDKATPRGVLWVCNDAL